MRLQTLRPLPVLLWAGLATALPGLACAAPFAYITNANSNTVTVIDIADNRVVDCCLAVGASPGGVAINRSGTRVYVANALSANVSVIDTGSHTVIATLSLGGGSSGLAVHPDGSRLYVAVQAFAGPNTKIVEVFDTSTHARVDTILLGNSATHIPVAIAVNPAGTRAYVSSRGGVFDAAGEVSVVDTVTNEEITAIAVGKYPAGLVVSGDGSRVYVAGYVNNVVEVIDADSNSVVASVPVGLGPVGVALNPAIGELYVTNNIGQSISILDTTSQTVIDTLASGDVPAGVDVNSSGTRLYVVNTGTSNIAGHVAVFDTTSWELLANATAGLGAVAVGRFVGPDAAALIILNDGFEPVVGPARN